MPLEKVRTAARALNRLVQRAVEAAGDGPVSVAVHHLAAPERAERLADGTARAPAGPARTARQRARRGDRCARRARLGRASSSRRSGRNRATRTARTRRTAATERRSGRTCAAACRLSVHRSAARRPQVSGRIHRSSGRPASAADRLPSVRPVRLSSRRSDDADVIRARLRALLEETNRARGWLPDDDLVADPEAEDWDDDAVTVPVRGTGSRRHRASRGTRTAPRARARRRAGTPGGSAPAPCGSPAWSRPSCWSPGRGSTGPQVEPAPVAPAGSAPSATSPAEPSVGEVAETSATVVVSVVGFGGAARAGDPAVGCARGRGGRGRRRPAAGGRPGVGQPRRRRHRRPADRRGCAGRRGPGRTPPAPAASGGPVNLNTATVAELDALPGRRVPSSPSASSTTGSRARSPASTNWTTCPASGRPGPRNWPSW